MANPNLKKLNEFSAKYNVSFQPLYTKQAVEKGNLSVVHNAIIGGSKYTCLCQYNNTQLEDLFKRIASGEDTIKSDNTVLFSKNDTVSINGERYRMFDVVKDMDYNRICEIVGDYKMNGEDWQVEVANKITEWLKNGGLSLWLEYQYYKYYNEFVDDYECAGV